MVKTKYALFVHLFFIIIIGLLLLFCYIRSFILAAKQIIDQL